MCIRFFPVYEFFINFPFHAEPHCYLKNKLIFYNIARFQDFSSGEIARFQDFLSGENARFQDFFNKMCVVTATFLIFFENF